MKRIVAPFVVPFVIGACAKRAPAPVVAQQPKPHVVSFVDRVAACEKSSTRLPLDPSWQPESGGGAQLVLVKKGCRAVMVVRADLLERRGTDFDEAWLAAENRARAFPLAWNDKEAQRDEIREDAAKNGRAAIAFNGLRLAYAIDQLASLTCSYFVVGEASCLGEPTQLLSQMETAPLALRTPDKPPEAPRVRNMGPAADSSPQIVPRSLSPDNPSAPR